MTKIRDDQLNSVAVYKELKAEVDSNILNYNSKFNYMYTITVYSLLASYFYYPITYHLAHHARISHDSCLVHERRDG